jgi:hypothetical protein
VNATVFIASSSKGRAGRGMSRAERNPAGEWRTQVVADAYDVRCLARHPVDAGTVYAGTEGDGVLRSTDAGATWQPLGLPGRTVKSLAVHPQRPEILYAGTNPARFFVSRDGGGSWHESPGFRRIPGRWWWFSPAERPWTAYVQAISVSPGNPDVILAGMEFGAVVRSDDGGTTWSGHRRGALRDCHSMTFHHTNGAWAYEGGAGWRAGGAVSRDGGQTWSQPRQGLERSYGWSCAADPAQPEVWYLAASTGPGDAHSPGHANAHIYRATPGAAWLKLAGGLPDPLDHLPASLLTDPSAPGHLYAGLTNGDVWFSSNHGDEWREIPVDLQGIWYQLVML